MSGCIVTWFETELDLAAGLFYAECPDCGQSYELDSDEALGYVADGREYQCDDCGFRGQL